MRYICHPLIEAFQSQAVSLGPVPPSKNAFYDIFPGLFKNAIELFPGLEECGGPAHGSPPATGAGVNLPAANHGV
jgi:hypothetical protein